MPDRSPPAQAAADCPRLQGPSAGLPKHADRSWPVDVSGVVHGARIGVRVNDPAALDEVLTRLPPRWKPSRSLTIDVLFTLAMSPASFGSGPEYPHRLYAGSACLAQTIDRTTLFERLESALHFSVAVHARRKLFVHAGVVGWRGAALVFPGRSFSGKSTLCAALVRAGATYYSDEYAVLDRQGRVHPYPKPLSLRSTDGLQTQRCPVDALGGQRGTEPLPIGLIVLTRFQGGATWAPRQLSAAEALLGLLEHTVQARARPRFALAVLQRAVADVRAATGRRGEAAALAETLLNQFEAVHG